MANITNKFILGGKTLTMRSVEETKGTVYLLTEAISLSAISWEKPYYRWMILENYEDDL